MAVKIIVVLVKNDVLAAVADDVVMGCSTCITSRDLIHLRVTHGRGLHGGIGAELEALPYLWRAAAGAIEPP